MNTQYNNNWSWPINFPPANRPVMTVAVSNIIFIARILKNIVSQGPLQQHTINRIHYYPAVMVLANGCTNPHHALDTHTEPMVQYVQYCYSDPTEQGRERVQAACYLSTQQPGEQHGICTVAHQAFSAISVNYETK
jgi:hypothetical protein